MITHKYIGEVCKSRVLEYLFNPDQCLKFIYTYDGKPNIIEGSYSIPSKFVNEAELVTGVLNKMDETNMDYAVIYTNEALNSNTIMILDILFRDEERLGTIILMCRGEE